ncbi:hypothetical protein [Xylocopilactobacillus apicola]|uniref:Uncharacterized protein n=1 Tax=Xylocopilactobacillus apicola TaxID=2932184 RepID=A0AAU9DT92_9LACO|nr:hypothetical protein [Xylocopilactobacillus apicola]BDR59329.1 hypothetical protein XA3_17700 [Xylocopilactobacillus apicola]
MTKYHYSVSGEYKDWIKIYKNNTLVHNGSLLGLILNKNGKIVLRLNYGTNQYFETELKYSKDFIVVVPLVPEMLKDTYKYVPIIFSDDEFKTFLEVIYADVELFKNLPDLSKQDLLNMWLLSSSIQKNYLNLIEMENDILNRILFLSNDKYDVGDIKYIIKELKGSIYKIPENSEDVVSYIDSADGICEWNGLIKIGEKIHLKIDEDHYAGI